MYKSVRKLLLTFVVLFSLFFVSSCTSTSWERFPDNMIKYKERIYQEARDLQRLTFKINLPEEVFEELGEYYGVELKIYLDVSYKNPDTGVVETIQSIYVKTEVYSSGWNEYYGFLDISYFIKGYSNKNVVGCKFTYALYRVIVSNKSVNGGPSYGKIVKGFNTSLTIASVSMSLTSIALGVFVNVKLTKMYKKPKNTEKNILTGNDQYKN